MSFLDGDIELGDVAAGQTLAAGGHAARHTEVKGALEEIRDGWPTKADQADLDAALIGEGNVTAPPSTDKVLLSTGTSLGDHEWGNSRDLPVVLETPRLPGGNTWLVTGASITNGAGSSNAGTLSFPALIRRKAGSVVALGYSSSRVKGFAGESSSYIAAQIDTTLATAGDVLIIGPDFVTNNGSGGTISLAAALDHLRTCVDAAWRLGLPVVVCNNIPRSAASVAENKYVESWNLLLWLWAHRSRRDGGGRGVRIADCYGAVVNPATGGLLAANDSGDGVHPSDAGHLAIAEALAPVLRRCFRNEPIDLPWPVVSVQNIGLIADPLNTAGWTNLGGTMTPTQTIEAPTAGDGLPAGDWIKFTYANSSGSSKYGQHGRSLDNARYTTGDRILYLAASKGGTPTPWGDIRVNNGATYVTTIRDRVTSDAALFDRTNPTVAAGNTSLNLTAYLSVPDGDTRTFYVGASQAYNLTQLGIEAIIY